MDIFNTYKKIATKLIPDLKNNDFHKTGLLTKEEFIIAGDYLTTNYTEWKWVRVINKKVPFLILKDVQYKNINSFLLDNQNSENDDDSWNVCTNTLNKKDEVKIEKKYNERHNDIDLSEFEMEMENEDDESTIPIDNSILEKKSYNITITYDNYYRTPRIWFHAHKLNGDNILNEKILEDFSIEHTNVSIKIETHPYYNLESVSVHPCKHADVMKKLIKIELENDKVIEIKHYFIYFLKFVSCIFPHISFDFTVQYD